MTISTVLVGGLLARGAQNQGGMMQAQAPARVAELGTFRALVARKNQQLLFDVSVTPHWFLMIDRLPDGQKYDGI